MNTTYGVLNNSSLIIDTDKLRENVRTILRSLPAGTKLIPVVKDDAYGMGMVGVARTLSAFPEIGCLAVANVSEGVMLRREGIRQDILIMGSTLPFQYVPAVECDLTVTVSRLGMVPELAEVCKAQSKPLNVQIKLETGMHRIGVEPGEELAALIGELKAAQEWVHVTGAFSHFAWPGNAEVCEAQYKKLLAGAEQLKAAGIPVRFAATKLVEGDQRIEEALKLDQNEKEMIEHIIVQMERERGLDRAAAIADMRFSFIQELVAKTVVKPHESKEQLRSNRIDKFLTGKYTAIPAFIAIMGLVFFLTFNVIGLFFQNLMETGIDALTGIVDTALTNWNVNAAVHSLLIDGIFTGVGSVLSFLPIIVVLFFFLSMLEDTGYMARVAFVMDKLLRRIGLSGRSIVPMLIGFGCTVPGVMASRTLPSERDRKMTILLTPFMSCSAKLPIYSLFAAAFFPQYAGLVMVLLYFTGIAVGVLAALLLKSTVFKGEAVPFVMELPNYRLPGLKNVAQLLWEKARDFLQKAFTVIFAATIVIWFLQNFDLQLRLTADPQASILARIAGDIAPLFGPLGFADWRISTALITGFMAKESVVSSLLILFGSEAALSAALTPAQAAPLLVFCLLYTPCIAAVASVKRELGNKWAVIMVVNQCAVAWLCALLVRLAAVVLF